MFGCMGFIKFDEIKDTGKTKVFSVKSLDEFKLGVISWYPSWRRYTFQPSVQTIFDSKCLIEISEFIDTLMKERK